MEEVHFFGKFCFKPSLSQLTLGVRPIPAASKQLELLAVLLRAKGKAVSREELIDKLWPERLGSEQILTQTVLNLRKTLGRLPDGGDYVETVHRKGYCIATVALRLPCETPYEARYGCDAEEVNSAGDSDDEVDQMAGFAYSARRHHALFMLSKFFLGFALLVVPCC